MIKGSYCSIRATVKALHTMVCTIFILCCLMLWITPGMSTTFSLSICSRTRSIVMKVPVRPIPALEEVCVESNASNDHGSVISPAVDHHWALGRFVLFLHSPVEGQDGCGIVRHPMIRPGREVELSHLQSSLRVTNELQSI